MFNIISFILNLPALSIPFLICLKIILGDKMNKKLFYSLLIVMIAITMLFFVIHIELDSDISRSEVLPFYQLVNFYLSYPLENYFSLYPILLMIVYPIFVIISLFIYFKDKQISVFKRLGVTTLVLALLLIFSIPTFMVPKHSTMFLSDEERLNVYSEYINNVKKADKYILLPPMRAYYYDQASLQSSIILSNKYEVGKKLPDYTSDEAQNLINDYLFYKEEYAKLADNSQYNIIALFCAKVRRYDDALKYQQLAEKLGFKNDLARASIHILRGEYDKALPLVSEKSKFWGDKKKLAFIYIGLKDFDKAEKILNEEETTTDKYWKPRTKVYFDYKKGNINQAKKRFKHIQENNEDFKDFTFEEYIKYIESKAY